MTGYLLDTHVLLWANAAPERLGPHATSRLLDEGSRLIVSAVAAAEIAIKRSIGRLEMSVETDALIDAIGAEALPLTIQQAGFVAGLPFLHRDPFDRLLVAQALTEGLSIVTADDQVLAYPVDTLDARS
ncbi:MAG: type II toxin-antitoxin system VapC family toxin [Microthrixaceae bacterium]|nr:type II toxin-antitoxin system VapC family toxin [Microthrixaceae bacterium]